MFNERSIQRRASPLDPAAGSPPPMVQVSPCVPPVVSSPRAPQYDRHPFQPLAWKVHFHLKHPDSQDDQFADASLSEPQPDPEFLNHSRIVYILAKSMVTGFLYFRVMVYNLEYGGIVTILNPDRDGCLFSHDSPYANVR